MWLSQHSRQIPQEKLGIIYYGLVRRRQGLIDQDQLMMTRSPGKLNEMHFATYERLR